MRRYILRCLTYTVEGRQNTIPYWFAQVFNTHGADFGIETMEDTMAFVANVIFETGHFEKLEENLCYSAKGLMRVWPKRFEGVAEKYQYKPVDIANRAYANRMGNGGESTGDGYRYRGRGCLMITGRSNYEQFAHDIRYKKAIIVNDPDLVTCKLYAVLSAFWFWEKNKLGEVFKKQGMRVVVKRITGGDVYASREQLYYDLMQSAKREEERIKKEISKGGLLL